MLSSATAKTVWARKLRAIDGWFSPVLLLPGAALLMLLVYAATRTTYWNVDLHGAQYKLAVASSPTAQQKGLGSRTRLAATEGMVFVFPNADKRCFWMKDMHFSLDILWADGAHKVVRIEHNVSPATYPKDFCASNAMYVFELPSGTTDRQHIHVGDQLKF